MVFGPRTTGTSLASHGGESVSEQSVVEQLASPVALLPPRDYPSAIDVPSEPPPEYDGPIPYGMRLLAFIPMELSKAPIYFETSRPERLAGRIPLPIYTRRMMDLNSVLHSSSAAWSIFWIRYYRWILLGIVAVSALAATGLFFLLGGYKSLDYLFVPVLVPVVMLFLVPTHAKYIQLIDETTHRWSKEDGDAGTDLWYYTRTRQDGLWDTFINVKIAIFDKGVEDGGEIQRGVASEDLPVYISENRQ
ncbi:hypothetical protein BDR26DRAFT_865261 [Obelidium mucronatum]|nr:hypothetical protein BDR26DRAFT_865261 [Obelidium mucronatum]